MQWWAFLGFNVTLRSGWVRRKGLSLPSRALYLLTDRAPEPYTGPAVGLAQVTLIMQWLQEELTAGGFLGIH